MYKFVGNKFYQKAFRSNQSKAMGKGLAHISM